MSIKYLNIIEKSFELKKKDLNKIIKKENMELENYNWDSVTVINLITNVSDKYKKNIEPQKLKIKTFKDLDNFLINLIKKVNKKNVLFVGGEVR